MSSCLANRGCFLGGVSMETKIQCQRLSSASSSQGVNDMPTKRFFVPILVAVGVALTAGCKSKDNGKEDDGNGKNKTYESPQEVYAAHETAMQKNDFEGLLQCLSSDSIKYAAAGVALRAMLERNALAREERNRKEITEVSKIGWR